MTIERKTIRDFMQKVMREPLFEIRVHSRFFVCSCFERYTNHEMDLDERIEFIKTLKEYGRDFIIMRTKANDEGSQVLEFIVDPVNRDNWESAMNSIYQEGEANTQSMPEDTITDIDTFILTIVNAPTDEAVAELCNKATPEVLRNCVKGIIKNGTSNVRDFLNLIARMRNMQKEYFKTRNPQVLAECKILEGKVDKELERMTLALAGRGKQEAQA